MKINIFRGDLPNVSAKKEALAVMQAEGRRSQSMEKQQAQGARKLQEETTAERLQDLERRLFYSGHAYRELQLKLTASEVKVQDGSQKLKELQREHDQKLLTQHEASRELPLNGTPSGQEGVSFSEYQCCRFSQNYA